MQTGRFHVADQVTNQALDALDEHRAAASPTTGTGTVVLAALQASPYPDIDLTPPVFASPICETSRSDGVLLDTSILSEGRKPRPEPRVTAFYDAQPLNTLHERRKHRRNSVRHSASGRPDATRRVE